MKWNNFCPIMPEKTPEIPKKVNEVSDEGKMRQAVKLVSVKPNRAPEPWFK